jgi:peroxiredoxin
MPQFMFRLAAGAVLAAAIHAPVVAQAQGVPQRVQKMLEAMRVEKYASLSYADDKGGAISADEFVKQLDEGKAVGASKSARENGDVHVTLRLASTEQLAKARQAPSKVKPGEPFPEFHLTRLDGRAIDNDALKGKYTVVSFYFAECAPCIKEVPALNALAERRKDINMVAVTYDPIEVSKKFVAEHRLGWPIVPEAKKLVDAAGVKAYPTLALLDPQGKVVEFVFSGAVFHGGGIDAWLNEKITGND